MTAAAFADLPFWAAALLVLHVGAGFAGLVLAPLALAAVKGGRAHRRWGKFYFAAMSAVALTALILALWRPLPFLALVALLSFYLAFTGYRALVLKRTRPRLMDWAAALIAAAACAALVVLGLLRAPLFGYLWPVAVALGLLGLRAALLDLHRFATAAPSSWVGLHLERMLASYIAALTAFSVVTLSRIAPHAGIVLWLWPSLLGVPAIIFASLHYRRRFAARLSA